MAAFDVDVAVVAAGGAGDVRPDAPSFWQSPRTRNLSAKAKKVWKKDKSCVSTNIRFTRALSRDNNSKQCYRCCEMSRDRVSIVSVNDLYNLQKRLRGPGGSSPDWEHMGREIESGRIHLRGIHTKHEFYVARHERSGDTKFGWTARNLVGWQKLKDFYLCRLTKFLSRPT
jgi:hypothetical protein